MWHLQATGIRLEGVSNGGFPCKDMLSTSKNVVCTSKNVAYTSKNVVYTSKHKQKRWHIVALRGGSFSAFSAGTCRSPAKLETFKAVMTCLATWRP